MHKALRAYEKSIVLALLMLAVFLFAIELAIILFQQIMTPPKFLLDVNEMLEVFGFFLMVLIGLELLETIKAYLQEDRVHAKDSFSGPDLSWPVCPVPYPALGYRPDPQSGSWERLLFSFIT